jgi:hypothetical protein
MTRKPAKPASTNDREEASAEGLKRNPKSRLEPDHDVDVNDLTGKTDSGPEPDVFGREIPPQD